MKPVPLILLLASVLLTSHVRPGACRPRNHLPVLFDGGFKSSQQLVDEVLLRAAGGEDDATASSYLLLGEKILKFLQRNPRGGPSAVMMAATLPLQDDEGGLVTSRRGGARLAHLARSLASWETEESAAAAAAAAREEEEEGQDELVELSKRMSDDPPISIDLTFHLLRNMIEMAKIESQREQAVLNRKFLDEVGK